MQIGLYSAAAGMYAQQTWIDAIANDMANVNTAGYSAQRLGFRDLMPQADSGVRVGSGAAVVDAGRDFAQGAMQQTGDPLSIAITGPGFIQVRRQDGSVALTRNGALQLDARGSITTADGHQLVPPVRIPAGTPSDQISIAPDGTVKAGGVNVGRIRVVTVTAPAFLRALGDTEFAPTAQSGGPRAAAATTVQQGYVEGSNVDLSMEFVHMIAAQRSYDLDSRAIQTQDQLMQIANGIRQ